MEGILFYLLEFFEPHVTHLQVEHSGAMFGSPLKLEVSLQSVSNAPKGVPSMRRREISMVVWKNPILLGYDRILSRGFYSEKNQEDYHPEVSPMKKSSIKFLNVVFAMMFVVSLL